MQNIQTQQTKYLDPNTNALVLGLEVRKKYEDFLLWLFNKINTFPKSQKFILGEEIGKMALKIQKDIIILQYSPVAERRIKIKPFNIELDVFRSLMRLAWQMKFLSHKSFLFQESKIDEVGRMVYGLAFSSP